MSHISKIKLQLKNLDTLRKTLEEMGAEVLVGQDLQTKTPYNSVPVDMLINPKGCKTKNFMGARWEGEEMILVGDDYEAQYKDRFRMDQFGQDLSQKYAKNEVISQFQLTPELQDFTMSEETNAAGETVLRFQRWD